MSEHILYIIRIRIMIYIMIRIMIMIYNDKEQQSKSLAKASTKKTQNLTYNQLHSCQHDHCNTESLYQLTHSGGRTGN